MNIFCSILLGKFSCVNRGGLILHCEMYHGVKIITVSSEKPYQILKFLYSFKFTATPIPSPKSATNCIALSFCGETFCDFYKLQRNHKYMLYNIGTSYIFAE